MCPPRGETKLPPPPKMDVLFLLNDTEICPKVKEEEDYNNFLKTIYKEEETAPELLAKEQARLGNYLPDLSVAEQLEQVKRDAIYFRWMGGYNNSFNPKSGRTRENYSLEKYLKERFKRDGYDEKYINVQKVRIGYSRLKPFCNKNQTSNARISRARKRAKNSAAKLNKVVAAGDGGGNGAGPSRKPPTRR